MALAAADSQANEAAHSVAKCSCPRVPLCRRQVYREIREAARRNREAAIAAEAAVDAGAGGGGFAAFLGVPEAPHAEAAPPPHDNVPDLGVNLAANVTWAVPDFDATQLSPHNAQAPPSGAAPAGLWPMAQEATEQTHLRPAAAEPGHWAPPAAAANVGSSQEPAQAGAQQDDANEAAREPPEWAALPPWERKRLRREAERAAQDAHVASMHAETWKQLQAAAAANKASVMRQIAAQDATVPEERSQDPPADGLERPRPSKGMAWEIVPELCVAPSHATGVCVEGGDTPRASAAGAPVAPSEAGAPANGARRGWGGERPEGTQLLPAALAATGACVLGDTGAEYAVHLDTNRSAGWGVCAEGDGGEASPSAAHTPLEIRQEEAPAAPLTSKSPDSAVPGLESPAPPSTLKEAAAAETAQRRSSGGHESIAAADASAAERPSQAERKSSADGREFAAMLHDMARTAQLSSREETRSTSASGEAVQATLCAEGVTQVVPAPVEGPPPDRDRAQSEARGADAAAAQPVARDEQERISVHSHAIDAPATLAPSCAGAACEAQAASGPAAWSLDGEAGATGASPPCVLNSAEGSRASNSVGHAPGLRKVRNLLTARAPWRTWSCSSCDVFCVGSFAFQRSNSTPRCRQTSCNEKGAVADTVANML